MTCFVSVPNTTNLILQVSVLVKNTGSKAGDHSVLLFATDLVRRVEPRYKLLKGFDKVRLEPGEPKKVRSPSMPQEVVGMV